MSSEAKVVTRDIFKDMMERRHEAGDILLNSIKAKLPELEALLKDVSDHWGYEDMVYRFYHHSFKVYRVQNYTQDMVKAFRELAPDRELSSQFMEIIKEGTGKSFKLEHNQRWMQETRPLVEAFYHAKYFLEMIIKYGKQLEQAPNMLPSGWATVLYLYGLR